MRKTQPPRDGFDEARAPRANRKRGADDRSMLGRGHGFGPHSSGRGRDMRTDAADRDQPDQGLERNYARVANQPGAGAPRTLEEEQYPRGSMKNAGYGRRSRSMESRKRPVREGDFDKD